MSSFGVTVKCQHIFRAKMARKKLAHAPMGATLWNIFRWIHIKGVQFKINTSQSFKNKLNS